MRQYKTLADRKADQAKAREKQAEQTRKFTAKPVGGKKTSAKAHVLPLTLPVAPVTTRPQRPWASVRAGNARLTYQSRTSNDTVAPQPWTKDLLSTLLAAADQGGVTLCLVWPAKITALPLLHALANVERVFAKDLRGLRTLLYPGTHACRAPLHSVLANREVLSAFYRTLWVQQANGSFEAESWTSSPAFLAALWALNDLTQHTPWAPNPSLAELVPTFVFDPAKRAWTTTVSNPLERTLAKVERLALRRDLRQRVSLEWDIADKAPGALMVLHHTAKKESWRTALAAQALKASGHPEVLLLDATDAAMRTNYAAVKRIPDFLTFAQENGFSAEGAIIVTDDPKAYRGRIGLLTQELERRLAEVPNPLVISKLREMSLTFKFEENGHNGQSGEQAYVKFELEGGGRAYASGWVYRHLPDEDPPFRRAAPSAIQPGDFIFDMSDELRTKLESSLQLNSEGVSSVVDPVRTLLKLYHDDVQRRCTLMFKFTKRSALAREIHAKMVELDPKAADCRPGRVYYWLALQAKDDTRPHASKDAKYFKVFCKALGINDEAAEQHWAFVRNARRLNQHLGRELVARYAEILFQPESAATYRKVPEGVIRQLQQEALYCVYRVERVVPPLARMTTNKEGETNAHP